METLVNQRIQFFLGFFTAAIGGALAAKLQMHMTLVLALGAAISLVLALGILRARQKGDTILGMLRQDWSHPYTLVRAAAPRFPLTMRTVCGKYLPFLCVAALAAGAVLSHLEILTVGTTMK